MPRWLQWVFGLVTAAVIVVVPIVHYRQVYTDYKRLREVTPGEMYRSGQLTVAGFTDAVDRIGIRTIVNLQEDYPDPDIAKSYWCHDTIKESEMCRQLSEMCKRRDPNHPGVKYVFIGPDTLPHNDSPAHQPAAIKEFVKRLHDDKNYPFPWLIHCHAGLHRTGVMVAVYRMEMEGWTPQQAVREVKANGFGEWACTSANEYVRQYVLNYRKEGTGSASSRCLSPLSDRKTGTGSESSRCLSLKTGTGSESSRCLSPFLTAKRGLAPSLRGACP